MLKNGYSTKLRLHDPHCSFDKSQEVIGLQMQT